MSTLVSNQFLAVRWLQKSSIWRTVCVGHPHVQYGVIYRIQMLASHAFSPRISICSRKAAIDSAFDCPLYRGRVAVVYGVFYVVALCAFAAFFYHRFHLVSAHLAMHVVDLYLCWWPPSLYCCGGALPAQRRVSAQCYSSSYISYSLSAAYRRSAFQLVYLGALPLWRGLTPHMYFSTWCMSFFTGCPCTVVALCIAVVSIQTLNSGTAASRSITVRSVRLQAPVILYRH